MRRKLLEQDCIEHLEELLVPNATVEHLLHEHFLIGILELSRCSFNLESYRFEEVVGVGVESLDDGVKGLYALDATVNEL